MDYVVIGLSCFVLSFVCGVQLGKIFFRPKTRSYTISNERLNEWIKQYYNDKDYSKLDFTEFVTDWLAGKVPPQPMSNSGTVKIEEPCLGPDCSCFPTREDHCTCMTKNGLCRHTINLNVLCGIHDCVEEIRNRSDLLSPSEIELLTEVVKAADRSDS